MTYEQQNYHHTAPPRARQEVHFKEKGCTDLIIADELKSGPQAFLKLLSYKKKTAKSNHTFFKLSSSTW